jgi:hypothetical protein
MPAAEQRDEHMIDERELSYDAATKLAVQRRARFGDLANRAHVGVDCAEINR